MTDHEIKSMKAIAAHAALVELEPKIAAMVGTHMLSNSFSDKPLPDCVLRDDVLKLVRKEAAAQIEKSAVARRRSGRASAIMNAATTIMTMTTTTAITTATTGGND